MEKIVFVLILFIVSKY